MSVAGTLVEVAVKGKVTQGLPGWLVGVDVHGVRRGSRVVPHRRRGHHGDASHGAVAQFAALLQSRHDNPPAMLAHLSR